MLLCRQIRLEPLETTIKHFGAWPPCQPLRIDYLTSKTDLHGSLSLAQAVFQTQHNRWDTEKCGGGFKWQIFFTNPGYTYKNTISNGCFFNIAARLYKYLGNDTYSDWAEKTWEWEQSIGLISSDFHFFDGTGDAENCTSIKKIQWTYNAGVHISGAAAMWNVVRIRQLWLTEKAHVC